MPINTCWLYDDDEDVFQLVAATDEAIELIGEPPTYTGDGSLSWDAFETGDIMLFHDVREATDRYTAATSIRSKIILLLGDYGVRNIGATDVNAFDEIDVSLVSILAANTQTALERADRDQQLTTTRDQATRLNRQLTVFNYVVRHNLRNTANVIHGHANLLVE